MTKVLISGASFSNKGAEAMLRTVQMELAKRLPDCEFFLWRPPELDCRFAFDSGFIPFRLPFEERTSRWHWSKGQRVSILLWSLLELCRTQDPRQVLAVFEPNERLAKAAGHYLNRSMIGFDAVVDISGFAYGDTWGVSGFRRIAPLMNYCVRNAKPVLFLPQAWGSFDNPQVRKALRQLLSDENTLFYPRDESSCRHLETALEKPRGSFAAYADIVFGFQGGNSEQGEHILRSMGCTMSRPIIGVAPNMRVYERVSGKGTGNIYLQALAKLVKHCIRNHNVDIVLQANEIAANGNRIDDRYLCSLIAASVNDSDHCFMTRVCLTAEATKSMIGRFDYLIGSRFHSLVFGFSQGVPGMAVSWSHKYHELLSLFDMESSVQEWQTIDADQLISIFERGWIDRQNQQPAILEKVKQLRAGVEGLFDDVATTIRGRTVKQDA